MQHFCSLLWLYTVADVLATEAPQEAVMVYGQRIWPCYVPLPGLLLFKGGSIQQKPLERVMNTISEQKACYIG